MKFTLKRLALSIASAGLLTIYGCGGGGGTAAEPGAVVAQSFSGNAAAGLPLVGTVTVKDANGASRSTPIGANGAYTVDVTGMTAPFVFRAEGNVGGRNYILHSAASAADVNGTINITPLTDLIVANIAGQLAEGYFNTGNFSTLTKTELDAETSSLRAKLLPMLQAMGVDSSIDLLRTAFTPLSSALDKALDVISVSVDPITNAATITNLVTQQQIVDSLATKAAAETAATPLDGAGMTTAADDITLVRKALSDFAARFATGLPAPGVLLPLMHDTTDLPFRNADQNAAGFSNEIATASDLIGAQFTDVVIRRLDYTTVSAVGGGADVYPRAHVDFIIKNAAGVAIDRVMNMQIAKGTDGVWRLRGDGRRLDIYGHAHMVKDGISGCVSTGLEFGFQDPNSANNGTGIKYMMVNGPGLPSGGLKYVRSAIGDQWTIQNVIGQIGQRYYVLSSNCASGVGAGLSDTAIAAIPADAVYTLTAFDVNNAPTIAGGAALEYRERIPGRPLTLAKAVAATFPTITLPSASSLSAYSGGDLTISASGISPAGAWVYLGLTDSADFVTSVDADVNASAAGSFSTTLNLGAASGVKRREIRVESDDAYWRNMMTVLNYYMP